MVSRRKKSRGPSHLRVVTDADVADASERPADLGEASAVAGHDVHILALWSEPGPWAGEESEMRSESDLDPVARQFFEATREKDR